MAGAPKIHSSFSYFSSLVCPSSTAWNAYVIAGSLLVIVYRESKGHAAPLPWDGRELEPEVLGTDPYQPIKTTSRQLSMFLVAKS